MPLDRAGHPLLRQVAHRSWPTPLRTAAPKPHAGWVPHGAACVVCIMCAYKRLCMHTSSRARRWCEAHGGTHDDRRGQMGGRRHASQGPATSRDEAGHAYSQLGPRLRLDTNTIGTRTCSRTFLHAPTKSQSDSCRHCDGTHHRQIESETPNCTCHEKAASTTARIKRRRCAVSFLVPARTLAHGVEISREASDEEQ